MDIQKIENTALQLARWCYDKKYDLPALLFPQSEAELFVDILNQQKLLPLVHKKMLDSGSTDHPLQIVMKGIVEKNAIHCNNFLIALDELSKALYEDGIDYLVLKGIPLSLQIYGSPSVRISNDIDLLVRESDMEKANTVLRRLNYEQFNNYNETQVFEKPLYKYAGCHEYFPYRKQFNNESVEVELARYLHWIKDPIYVEKLFASKTLIEYDGLKIPSISSAALIAQMIENIYENAESMYNIIFGGTNLLNYVDLMNYIKLKNVSPKDFAQAVQEFDLKKYATLVLEYLKEIFYLDSEWIESAQDLLGLTVGNNIIPRILNRTAGIEHYLNNVIKEIYSPANKYFNNIQQNHVVYHTDCGKPCHISFSKMENSIILDMYIGDMSVLEFQDYILEIKVYKNDLNQHCFCSTILIFGDCRNLYLSNNKLYDKYDNTYYIKQGLHRKERMSIAQKTFEKGNSVYINALKMDLSGVCNLQGEIALLAVNVSLDKKQAENVYFNDVAKSFDSNNIPIIGV